MTKDRKIERVERAVREAIEDARQDGGRLVIGVYRAVSRDGTWWGCVIGCALGDLSYDFPLHDWHDAFAERYGVTSGEALALDWGFETGGDADLRPLFARTELPFFDLGARLSKDAEPRMGKVVKQ